MPLPINIDNLLTGAPVEWERLEFKEGWNPQAVLHTLCAFANDFHNLGGGYVVIGVAERDGLPVLPPAGLSAGEVEAIQKEVLNLGHGAIQPQYHPIIVPDVVEGKRVLVLWSPGGQTRPYKAKLSLGKDAKEWGYFIRRGSSTVRAKGADEQELLSLAATVPFDDRIYHRSYEEREPVEVRISPEELAVLSFPGPDRSIRLADLRRGKAVSRRYRNRRIGEFLKELDLTEGRATGIPKILRAMRANGSPAPKFETDDDRTSFLIRLPVHPQAKPIETPQVTPQVEQLVSACDRPLSREELQERLGLQDRENFRKLYLLPALESGLVERTIPDKPNSRLQKYRLTRTGVDWLRARLKPGGGN